MRNVLSIMIGVITAFFGFIAYRWFKRPPADDTRQRLEDIMKARTTAHTDIEEWEKDEKAKLSNMSTGSVLSTANAILRKRRSNRGIDPERPDDPDDSRGPSGVH